MAYRTTVKFNLTGETITVPQTGYNTTQEQPVTSTTSASATQILIPCGILLCIFLAIFIFQKFSKRRTAKRKIFPGIFSLFLLCGFGSLAAYNFTNAATLDFSVPETLEISGNVGEFAYGCETITLNIATNYGYSLYASVVDSTSFSTADGQSFIKVIPQNGTLLDNSWGLAQKTAEISKTNSWLSAPQYTDGTSDGVLVADYDDETAAGQETTICYGFLTNQEAAKGLYSATIDFRVAVDQRTPKAILGTNGNLNFVFDENTYTVGGSYTDNLGTTTIASVYDVPKNAATVYDIDASDDDEIDFNHDDWVTSANFDASFHDFKPRSTSYWFWHDDNLESLTNAENLNTSKVNSLSGMFAYAGANIDEISFSGLGNWDTKNVTDLSSMFENAGQDASTFTIDDLSGWNTENVTDIEYMFRKSGISNLNLSGWNLHNITDMHWLFHGTGGNASSLSFNLSNWNISSVTIMRGMFWNTGENAESLSIDLTGWNTENVEDMSYMFDVTGRYAETFSLTGIVDFDTSNVTDMRGMFSGTARDADYEIDLRGWNVTNVTSHSGFNTNVEDKVIAPIWAD